MQPAIPLDDAKAKSLTRRNRRFLTMCKILFIGLLGAYFAIACRS